MNSLYMVAAIHTQKQAEGYTSVEVVLQPITVVAKSEDQAKTKVLLGNENLAQYDADGLEVFVRPF